MAATEVRVNRGGFLSWLRTFIPQEEKEKELGVLKLGGAAADPLLYRDVCAFLHVCLGLCPCLCPRAWRAHSSGLCVWRSPCACLCLCILCPHKRREKIQASSKPPQPNRPGKKDPEITAFRPWSSCPISESTLLFLHHQLGAFRSQGAWGGRNPGGWLEEAEPRIGRSEERKVRGRAEKEEGALCCVCENVWVREAVWVSGHEGMCECVQVRVCVSLCRWVRRGCEGIKMYGWVGVSVHTGVWVWRVCVCVVRHLSPWAHRYTHRDSLPGDILTATLCGV